MAYECQNDLWWSAACAPGATPTGAQTSATAARTAPSNRPVTPPRLPLHTSECDISTPPQPLSLRPAPAPHPGTNHGMPPALPTLWSEEARHDRNHTVPCTLFPVNGRSLRRGSGAHTKNSNTARIGVIAPGPRWGSNAPPAGTEVKFAVCAERSSAGAVASRAWIWLIAAVKALTAPRRGRPQRPQGGGVFVFGHRQAIAGQCGASSGVSIQPAGFHPGVGGRRPTDYQTSRRD